MLNPLIKQVPVLGQAYDFTKTAMKVHTSLSILDLSILKMILILFF